MNIELLDGTTEFPLQKIGENAGICWNSPTNDPEKNVKRAKECIASGHGRVMEYVDIEFVLEGSSARMMRELYTHIGGDPTRLQSSTRYVDASNFKYFTPPKIESDVGIKAIYDKAMQDIANAYMALVGVGIPKEDAANILPLGMESKMVMKCNLRMLENLCAVRRCTRAYHEIRKFANELVKLLGAKNEEWKWLADNILVAKCEKYKYINPNLCYCTEANGCGKYPKLADLNIIKINK